MKGKLTQLILALSAFFCFVPAGLAADQSFSVKGVKIHYLIAGKGTPVLLLHSLDSSAKHSWAKPQTLSILEHKFRVIAPDLPGHGKSDSPEDDAAYGVQWVEDMVALLDHLGIHKVNLVGYSMGGLVALKFMALHPERSASALIGGIGWLQEGSELQKRWAAMPPHGIHGTPWPGVKGIAKLALSESELKSIEVPVEVVVGEQDPANQISLPALKRVRSDWPVITIPAIDHHDCISSEEFQNEIEKWLSKHATGG